MATLPAVAGPRAAAQFMLQLDLAAVELERCSVHKSVASLRRRRIARRFAELHSRCQHLIELDAVVRLPSAVRSHGSARVDSLLAGSTKLVFNSGDSLRVGPPSLLSRSPLSESNLDARKKSVDVVSTTSCSSTTSVQSKLDNSAAAFAERFLNGIPAQELPPTCRWLAEQCKRATDSNETFNSNDGVPDQLGPLLSSVGPRLARKFVWPELLNHAKAHLNLIPVPYGLYDLLIFFAEAGVLVPDFVVATAVRLTEILRTNRFGTRVVRAPDSLSSSTCQSPPRRGFLATVTYRSAIPLALFFLKTLEGNSAMRTDESKMTHVIECIASLTNRIADQLARDRKHSVLQVAAALRLLGDLDALCYNEHRWCGSTTTTDFTRREPSQQNSELRDARNYLEGAQLVLRKSLSLLLEQLPSQLIQELLEGSRPKQLSHSSPLEDSRSLSAAEEKHSNDSHDDPTTLVGGTLVASGPEHRTAAIIPVYRLSLEPCTAGECTAGLSRASATCEASTWVTRAENCTSTDGTAVSCGGGGGSGDAGDFTSTSSTLLVASSTTSNTISLPSTDNSSPGVGACETVVITSKPLVKPPLTTPLNEDPLVTLTVNGRLELQLTAASFLRKTEKWPRFPFLEGSCKFDPTDWMRSGITSVREGELYETWSCEDIQNRKIRSQTKKILRLWLKNLHTLEMECFPTESSTPCVFDLSPSTYLSPQQERWKRPADFIQRSLGLASSRQKLGFLRQLLEEASANLSAETVQSPTWTPGTAVSRRRRSMARYFDLLMLSILSDLRRSLNPRKGIVMPAGFDAAETLTQLLRAIPLFFFTADNGITEMLTRAPQLLICFEACIVCLDQSLPSLQKLSPARLIGQINFPSWKLIFVNHQRVSKS